MRLFSAPTPDDSAAVDAALALMRPIYRAVFEAVNNGMTPEQVMAKYSLNEKAVANILNAVRSRIATAMSAAADPSLAPAMREGKFDGGRPDLALSIIPEVAAIDQIRNESDVPGTESWADVVAEAENRLRADYAGEYEKGDRLVEYDHRTSTGYFLFRRDRLVWQNMAFRFNYGLHVSLRWNTDQEKFIALGNTKGFLNGDFIWPPEDWVNPVTDEQEKAYEEKQRQSFEKLLMEAKAES